MEIIEDNRIFRRLGLIKEIRLSLNATSDHFRNCFKENVGVETNFFGVSSHDRDFHGEIKNKTFEIYKRTRMFNNSAQAFAQGGYAEKNELLQIELAVFIPIGTFLTFFSALTVMMLIIIGLWSSYQAPVEVLIVFVSFLVFFYFYVYWHFKKMVNELTQAIEREFGFWLATSNALQHKL